MPRSGYLGCLSWPLPLQGTDSSGICNCHNIGSPIATFPRPLDEDAFGTLLVIIVCTVEPNYWYSHVILCYGVLQYALTRRTQSQCLNSSNDSLHLFFCLSSGIHPSSPLRVIVPPYPSIFQGLVSLLYFSFKTPLVQHWLPLYYNITIEYYRESVH